VQEVREGSAQSRETRPIAGIYSHSSTCPVNCGRGWSMMSGLTHMLSRLGCLIALAALGGSLWGQRIVTAAQVSAAIGFLEKAPGEAKLDCQLMSEEPRMGYSLRLSATFRVTLPLRQFGGKRVRLFALLRLVPENKDPVYLVESMFTPVPSGRGKPDRYRSGSLPWGGTFTLGEGNYRATLAVFDEAGRVRRFQWTIHARMSATERASAARTEPGTVGSVAWSPMPVRTGEGATRPVNLTVLLHAGPLNPARTTLRGRDVATTLTVLASVLNSLQLGKVQVTAFNLDRQESFFEDHDFSPAGFERLRQQVSTLDLNLVDVHTLANRRGHVAAVGRLLREAMDSEPRPDAVLVIGPLSRFTDTVPGEVLEAPAGGPRVFYFSLESPYAYRDTISSAVARVKGTKRRLIQPADLVKAIAELAESAGTGGRSPRTANH
jgi:hypothetical protein